MRAYITSTIKAYYRLTKPERTLTNVVTALAGFLFACRWHIDWQLFWHFIIGLTLVISSACVLNNFIDRNLDKKMQRTKKRALPSGKIGGTNSVIYATTLGVIGFWLLTYTNSLTVMVVAIAYIFYVFIYTLTKRHTVHSTLVGSLPGAASLVAGYTAVSNSFDTTALILFIIMLTWQMVHFYAIAIYRLKDYEAADMPTMPSVAGIRSTRTQMIIYLVSFIVSSLLLSVFSDAGYIYLITVGTLGLIWLGKTLFGFNLTDSSRWGREVFKFSLIVVVVMSVLISLSTVLP